MVPEIREIASSPATPHPNPTIGHGLHFPVRAMRRPIPNVAIVTPSIWGSIRRPDSVGDTKSESWK